MINPRPNVLLETGRTSYSGAIGTLPRKGGVRECFVPRPGSVFSSVDFEGGELVTHAQSCRWLVGWSALADALLAGVKPHNKLGATLAGVTYDAFNAALKTDKRLAGYRQASKAANFGFPGGMGELKLVLNQRAQGPDTYAADGTHYKGLRFCILVDGAERCGVVKVTSYKEKPCPPVCLACVESAARVRDAWFRTYPENREVFRLVSEIVERDGYVRQHVDERKRGGVTFTSAANGYFQGLLARVAKLALWRATRECYTDRASVLYGSRPIIFAHDEIFSEHPEDRAPEAAERVSAIMVQAGRETCPDLADAWRAEPAIMRRWYKGAEPARDASGRLVCWEPTA